MSKAVKRSVGIGLSIVGVGVLTTFWFLSQSNKGCACLPEWRVAAYDFFRVQAAWYAEKGRFAKDFKEADAGSSFGRPTGDRAEGESYRYRMYNLNRERVVLTIVPKQTNGKTTIAYGVLGDGTASSGKKTVGINTTVCQSNGVNAPIPKDFRFVGTGGNCPSDYDREDTIFWALKAK